MVCGQGLGNVGVSSSRPTATREVEVVLKAGILGAVRRGLMPFISIASTSGAGLSRSTTGIVVTATPTKALVNGGAEVGPSTRRRLATTVVGLSVVPRVANVFATTGRVPSIGERRIARGGLLGPNDVITGRLQGKAMRQRASEGAVV